LYIFWMDIKVKDRSAIVGGEQKHVGHTYTYSVLYSYRDGRGKWITTQKLTLKEIDHDDGDAKPLVFCSDICFPAIFEDQLYLSYCDVDISPNSDLEPELLVKRLDLFRNQLIDPSGFYILFGLIVPPGTEMLTLSGVFTSQAQMDRGFYR
jgi:hypothetical protein